MYPDRTAPPGWGVASSTRTVQPASASRLAATRPLCPAPMTIPSTASTGARYPRRVGLAVPEPGKRIVMDRGSNKHSPRVDDEMAHEVRGNLQGVAGGRIEEWKTPEPSGEDQPEVSLVP